MENYPLITIYMPTHNRSSLIGRAIDSVIKQTYQNWELVIVDDCSIDDTENVIKEYIKKDPRIKYIKNETNMGACFSRNRAINTAQGDFITGLDDDDYFLPDRLQDFIYNWANIQYDKKILFTTRVIIDGNGEYRMGMPRMARHKGYLEFNDILIGNYVGNQFYAMTSSLRDMGGFDDSLSIWQDYDVILSLLKSHRAYCISNDSYVVDQTHEHSRISTAKIDKLKDTYKLLLSKHGINSYFKKQLFKNNLFHYDRSFIEITPLVFAMIYRPNRQSVKLLLEKCKADK